MLVQHRAHDQGLMHGMKKFVSTARLRKDSDSLSGSGDAASNSSKSDLNKRAQNGADLLSQNNLLEPSHSPGDASKGNSPWSSHFKRGLSLRTPSLKSPSENGPAEAGAPGPAPKRKKVPYGMYGWRYADELDEHGNLKPKPNPVAASPSSPQLVNSIPEENPVNAGPANVSPAIAAPVSPSPALSNRTSISGSIDSGSIHSTRPKKKVPHGMFGWKYVDDDDNSSAPKEFASPSLAKRLSMASSKDDQVLPNLAQVATASSSGSAIQPVGPNSPRQRKKVPYGMYGWKYADEEISPRNSVAPASPKPVNAVPKSGPAIANVPEVAELSTNDPLEETIAVQQRWIKSIYNSEDFPAELPAVQSDPVELSADDDVKRKSSNTLPAIRNIDWSKIDEQDVPALLKAYNSFSTTDSGVAFPEGNEPAYVGKGKGRVVDADDSLQVNPLAGGAKGKGKAKVPIPLIKCNDSDDPLRSVVPIDAEELRRKQALTKCEEYFAQAAELEMKQEARRQAREEARQKELLEERERKWQIELELAREAEAAARRRECSVCGDSKDPLEYLTRTATPKCAHPGQICTECMHTWIASEFESKGCDGIKCPECPQTLDYTDVQRTASLATFHAFDALAARNALNASDEFAWCLGKGCSSGQLNIDNNSFMDCVTCGYKQCLQHKVPWHTGETCAQYEYRTSGAKAREEERQTEAMLEGISKRCPGVGCGWRIQKLDGCDHMTCRRCRHEFCWKCLAAQKEIRSVGNTAHAEDCPYHSHNLDIAWPFNAH